MKDKTINPENKALDNNNFLFCPTKDCLNIPNMEYEYNPLGSKVKFICNCNKNVNAIHNNKISEFLETISNIKCADCNLIITKNDIYYCIQCKKILDYFCLEYHLEHEVLPKDKNNLFDNCLDHNNPYGFYCKECNKSLCINCNINYHTNKGHNIIQISNNLNNKNSKEQLYFTFEKQKCFLEKIKKINENIIKSLENDLIIKEKLLKIIKTIKIIINQY